VLKLLAVESLTADEISERLGETILNIRPRVSELHALGQIADTDNRRENAGGHFTIVWRAT
jgi:hypothetical protein